MRSWRILLGKAQAEGGGGSALGLLSRVTKAVPPYTHRGVIFRQRPRLLWSARLCRARLARHQAPDDLYRMPHWRDAASDGLAHLGGGPVEGHPGPAHRGVLGRSIS